MKFDSEIISFKSKRNKVFLRGGIVEKHFASEKCALIESETLERLRVAGVRVPEICIKGATVLKMRYIPGKTLPDLIEHLENCRVASEPGELAGKLIGWLETFYSAVNTERTGEIRGDVNGRNFIFDDLDCWGVDFEETVYGAREQDIGRIAAFVLTYDPPGTELKYNLADTIMRKAEQILGIDMEEACRQRDMELEAISLRRATPGAS